MHQSRSRSSPNHLEYKDNDNTTPAKKIKPEQNEYATKPTNDRPHETTDVATSKKLEDVSVDQDPVLNTKPVSMPRYSDENKNLEPLQNLFDSKARTEQPSKTSVSDPLTQLNQLRKTLQTTPSQHNQPSNCMPPNPLTQLNQPAKGLLPDPLTQPNQQPTYSLPNPMSHQSQSTYNPAYQSDMNRTYQPYPGPHNQHAPQMDQLQMLRLLNQSATAMYQAQAMRPMHPHAFLQFPPNFHQGYPSHAQPMQPNAYPPASYPPGFPAPYPGQQPGVSSFPPGLQPQGAPLRGADLSYVIEQRLAKANNPQPTSQTNVPPHSTERPRSAFDEFVQHLTPLTSRGPQLNALSNVQG